MRAGPIGSLSLRDGSNIQKRGILIDFTGRNRGNAGAGT